MTKSKEITTIADILKAAIENSKFGPAIKAEKEKAKKEDSKN